jgi:hypothetical protein
VFHINWKGIQLTEGGSANQLPYTGNGGAAKSDGVELTVTARPFAGTTISGWFDYDNAVLSKDILNNPSTYGLSGDMLPFAARRTGSISVRQQFGEFHGFEPFASVDASYTGSRLGIFQPTVIRQEYPAFTQADLQVGTDYKNWSVNLYVNNIGDVRGQLNGGIGYAQNPAEFVIIQPRTIGVSITGKFGGGAGE